MRMMTRAEELQALQDLRARMRAEGLDKPTPVLAVSILVLHVTAMFAGLAALLYFDSIILRLIGVVVTCYGALGIALTAHNASHYTLTGNRSIDRALTYFCFTFLHGVSSCFWYHKHVRTHHVGPNTIGIDTDIDLLPFFAMSEDEVAAANWWQRKLFPFQHWLFPFAIALIMPNLKAVALRYLIGELRTTQPQRRLAAWADVACLCGHLALFVVVPAFFWPLWQVLLFYLVRDFVNGYLLFSVTAPAHFPLEAQFVRPREDGPSLIAGQIYTSVNFRAGFLLWLISQGVEHQIEHHLLPGANPLRLARVRAFIEPFCEQHGFPYQIMGWGEAMWKSLVALRYPRPVRILDDLVRDTSRTAKAA